MPNNQKEQLKQTYIRHISRIEYRKEELEGWSARFSFIRLFYFLGGVAALYFTSHLMSDPVFFLLLMVFLAGFLILVIHHSRIRKGIAGFNSLREIIQEQIARMDLDWNALPVYSPQPDLRNHPFADDLNILGEFSIHHLMDTAIYEGGTRYLKEWLLEEHPDKQEILKRQKLVQELKPLEHFRNKLRVKAKLSKAEVSEKDWSMEKLLKWMRVSKEFNYLLPLTILGTLAAANVTLLILMLAGIIGPYVLFTFVAYLMIYNFNSHKISGLFESAFQMEKLLSRFSEILLYVEKFSFGNSPAVDAFCADFKHKDQKPSKFLKKAGRLGGAASLQQNQVLWPLVNMVVPWDLFFAMKMENLKKELEPKLTHWTDIFFQLEALNSMANFAALNPHFIFADISEGGKDLFKAEELGHPLIPDLARVTNDFEVKKGQDLFLITGSNMAGKSTFLRTVGLNLVLVFAGAPVCASSLNTQLFRIFTSINVKDSLGEGLSHFYAEVRRLKRLLTELNEDHEYPLFFFVDEIFKGTNNRERFQGSTAFLKEVAGKKGIGMVSTHDLELANLEEEIPQLSNLHFEETIENGTMRFEYKLKSGPCATTNALKIMELEGLPVE